MFILNKKATNNIVLNNGKYIIAMSTCEYINNGRRNARSTKKLWPVVPHSIHAFISRLTK